ncbi:MAG: DNA replication/repair protein RecF [Actinomycetaceae bacterium]|nr:DNA replication/repair protein RecF [Actinomycetaceae bacterium]
MYVSHLALDDFRSYRQQVVEFRPGTTVLLGPNGQGKTNLVEAIAYLASFSSHRVAADTALVRFAKPGEEQPAGAVVRAKVHLGGRDRVLELEIIKGRANRAKLNRAPVRPTELLGIVKVVIFAPEDLDLVKGDPAGRRRFMDEIAGQMWPVFTAIKSDFDKVSRQRAALLKQMGKDRRAGRSLDFTGLQIWNDQYVPLARSILAYRLKVLDSLYAPVRAAHEVVSEQARELDLSYSHSLETIDEIDKQDLARLSITDPALYEQELLRGLDEVLDQEIARGVNLLGPHRDDLLLTLDSMPVKGYASHGESWSVALSLRLGSFDALIGEPDLNGVSETPILILDDVFSELDGRRREAVLRTIEKAEQVFITAAVGTDLPAELDAEVLDVRLDKVSGTEVSRPALGSESSGESVGD